MGLTTSERPGSLEADLGTCTVAVKLIKKKAVKEDVASVFEEMNVLKGLDHPNIGASGASSSTFYHLFSWCLQTAGQHERRQADALLSPPLPLRLPTTPADPPRSRHSALGTPLRHNSQVLRLVREPGEVLLGLPARVRRGALRPHLGQGQVHRGGRGWRCEERAGEFQSLHSSARAQRPPRPDLWAWVAHAVSWKLTPLLSSSVGC